jgi:hypothetical protein
MPRPPAVLAGLQVALVHGPLTFREVCARMRRTPEDFQKNFYTYVVRGFLVEDGTVPGPNGRRVKTYRICTGTPVHLPKKALRPKQAKPEKPPRKEKQVIEPTESGAAIVEAAMRSRTDLELAWMGV